MIGLKSRSGTLLALDFCTSVRVSPCGLGTFGPIAGSLDSSIPLHEYFDPTGQKAPLRPWRLRGRPSHSGHDRDAAHKNPHRGSKKLSDSNGATRRGSPGLSSL